MGCFDDALRLDPLYLLARRNRAGALSALGRTDEAIAEYRNVIRAKPEDGNAHNSLGLICYKQGKLDEAIAELTLACQYLPGSGAVFRNKGMALAAAGKLAESLASFEAALRLEPDNLEAKKGAEEVRKRLNLRNANP
jgi:Tfp pilus assembly protein PilF